MKILKTLLSIAFALAVALLSVAALTPNEYSIEKEIVISKDRAEVFSYIKQLRNQSTYSVWATMDPKMKKNFHGTDGTVGFISAWNSEHEKVGKGEQEITRIVPNERIDTELRFHEPFAATDSAYMTTQTVSDNSTKVTWGFSGRIPYPMNILLLRVDMDKEIGSDLARGLSNLKVLLESPVQDDNS